MVFDNATSVFINGEEVESIIFDGGGVLYQKEINEEPLVVSQLELNKTSGKQILSHADYSVSDNTEYCTLTATALDSNNRGVSGESIVFKNGNTVLDTITTDSNGHASYTYVSQGNGEVKISAECTVESNLLFEEYFIHDYYAYDSLTSDSGHWTSNDNKANTSYSDSGLDIYFTSGSSMHYYNNDISLPSSFVLEVTVPTSSTITGSYFNVMGISLISNSSVWRVGKSDVGIVYTSDIAPANNDVLKWEYDGINMKTYVNDTLLSSQTPNKSGLWIECGDTSTNHKYYKDMKIKPLVPIILSVSKKILSYVDYDDITITATLTNQNNTNIPITFNAIDSNNNIIDWGSDTTDSSGIATYTYYSQGAGDVIITAECGSFIQTYNIEDCTYYNPNAFTNKTSMNITLPNGDFEISFKVLRQSNNSNSSYIHLSNGTSDTALIGQLGSSGACGVWLYYSSTPTQYNYSSSDLNSETSISYKKEGTTGTFTVGNSSTTITDNLSHTKCNYIDVTNNKCQYLKIKPLNSLSL